MLIVEFSKFLGQLRPASRGELQQILVLVGGGSLSRSRSSGGRRRGRVSLPLDNQR
jgi:hypothetical protein